MGCWETLAGNAAWREFCLYLFQLYLRETTGVSGQICHTGEQAERATRSQLAALAEGRALLYQQSFAAALSLSTRHVP